MSIIKDYCGVLTEESIRKNFLLIYELLDECIDFGFPQATSTADLKAHIQNEPAAVNLGGTIIPQIQGVNKKSNFKASTAARKPVAVSEKQMKKAENEIFCDILENLSVTFSNTGQVINSSVEGCIQMKSYLSGNPELKLALNEDLVIGKGGQYGSVVLDDCNFHDCVQLAEFENDRVLTFLPPEGEFTVINYRTTGMWAVDRARTGNNDVTHGIISSFFLSLRFGLLFFCFFFFVFVCLCCALFFGHCPRRLQNPIPRVSFH
jgi:AP-4 complex subunit mu-1